LVKVEKGIIDLTETYKKMIDEWIEKYSWERWFMLEAEINVRNGWKVIIVPIEEWCSTTNIINKIKI
jgi:hypothetical protein